MHRIVRLACEKEIEGLSQIPPDSVSIDSNDIVAPSSVVWKTPINHTDYSFPTNPLTTGTYYSIKLLLLCQYQYTTFVASVRYFT